MRWWLAAAFLLLATSVSAEWSPEMAMEGLALTRNGQTAEASVWVSRFCPGEVEVALSVGGEVESFTATLASTPAGLCTLVCAPPDADCGDDGAFTLDAPGQFFHAAGVRYTSGHSPDTPVHVAVGTYQSWVLALGPG